MNKLWAFFIFVFLLTCLSVSAEEALRTLEKRLWVPAEEWRLLLKGEKEGVLLSLKDYEALYQKAKNHYQLKKEEEKNQSPFKEPFVSESRLTGTLTPQGILWHATLKGGNPLKKECFQEVDFGPVLFNKTFLNQKPVPFETREGKTCLLLPPDPFWTLETDFFQPLAKDAEFQRLSIRCPPSKAGEISLSVTGNVEVLWENAPYVFKHVKPEGIEYRIPGSGVSLLDFQILNAGSFEQFGLQTFVKELSSITLEKDHFIRESHFSLTIQGGEISQTDLTLSSDFEVSSLEGDSLARWEKMETQNGQTRYRLFYSVPVKDSAEFHLKAYGLRLELKDEKIILQGIDFPGATSKEGLLSLRSEPSTQVLLTSMEHADLRTSGEIPEKLSEFSKEEYPLFGHFNTGRIPFSIALELQKKPLQIKEISSEHLQIEPSKITFETEKKLKGFDTSENRFTFSTALPEGFQLNSTEVETNGVSAKAHPLWNASQKTLTVDSPLLVPIGGEVVLRFIFVKTLESESLKTTPQTLMLPRMMCENNKEEEGTLQISVDPDLTLENLELKGFSNTNQENAGTNKKSLLYLFKKEASGSLCFKKKTTLVTSETGHFIAFNEDLIQVNTFVKFLVLQGSQDKFFLAMPKLSTGKLNLEGGGIKEKKIITRQKLMEEGSLSLKKNPGEEEELWEITLQKPVTDSYILQGDYQEKIFLDARKNAIPLLTPLGVSNDSGFVILEASKTHEVFSQKTGLVEMEMFEIPKWPAYTPSKRILEALRYYTRPFSLSAAVKKNPETSVLSTLIEREERTFTLTEEGNIWFKIAYTLQNSSREPFRLTLPKDWVLWTALVNGAPVKPRKEGLKVLTFTLPDLDQAKTSLTLSGVIPLSFKTHFLNSLRMVLTLRFPEHSFPTLKTSLKIYYPDTMTLLDMTAPYYALSSVEPLFPKSLLRQFFDSFSAPSLMGRSGKAMSISSRHSGFAKQEASKSLSDDKEISNDEFAYAMPGQDIGQKMDKPALQKGLLSLNFQLPAEGQTLSLEKSRLGAEIGVTFASENGLRSLFIFSGIAGFLAGFFLKTKKILNGFPFLLILIVCGTALPGLGFYSWIVPWNGFILGAFFHVLLAVFKHIKPAASLACFLLFTLFFMGPSPSAKAEESGNFPDTTVYLPYQNVPRDISQEEPQVFLLPRDYFALKNWAEPPYQKEPELLFGKSYEWSQWSVQGVWKGKGVEWVGSADLFVSQKDWCLVELPFANLRIESLLVDGQTVPLRIKNNTSVRPVYELPVFGKGLHRLSFQMFTEASLKEGAYHLDLEFPQAASSLWEIDFGSEKPDVRINSPSGAFHWKENQTQKILNLFTAESGKIELQWTAPVQKTGEQTTKSRVEHQILWSYKGDQQTLNDNVKIKSTRALGNVLEFSVPDSMALYELLSKDIQSSALDKKSGTLKLFLKNPEQKECSLSLALVAACQSPSELLFLKARFPSLEKADVAIASSRGYFFETSDNYPPSDFWGGAMDPETELKSCLRLDPLPDQLKVKIQKTPLKIKASMKGQYRVEETGSTLELNLDLDPEEGIPSHLILELPSPYIPFLVESACVEQFSFDQNTGLLTLPFTHAPQGPFSIHLILKNSTPLEKKFVLKLPVLQNVLLQKGMMTISFPEKYSVSEIKIQGLRGIALDTSLTNGQSGEPLQKPVHYAYEFRESSLLAEYLLTPKETLVNALCVHFLKAEENRIRVKILCLVDVQNGASELFEWKVPDRYKDTLRVEGEGIRNVLKKTDPDGSTRIQVFPLKSVSKNWIMELNYEDYPDANSSFQFVKPRLILGGYEEDFFALETIASSQIEAFPTGKFREIEKEELPAVPEGVLFRNILWAYSTDHPEEFNLKLKWMRLEREKMAEARILRKDITAVFSPNGSALCEAVLKIQNKSLQFLPLEFPLSSQIWSLKVAGESVRGSLTPGKDFKTLLIPLLKSSTTERPFEIRLIYEENFTPWNLFANQSLTMFKTSENLTVDKTSLKVWLPETYRYRNFQHNLEETDLAEVEAGKTLELAKEYEYWSQRTKGAKGDMKESIENNRKKVLEEYHSQKEKTRQAQNTYVDQTSRTGLEAKGRRARLWSGMNEAENLVIQNQSVMPESSSSDLETDKGYLKDRSSVQGWQFKTTETASVQNKLLQNSLSQMAQKEIQSNLETEKLSPSLREDKSANDSLKVFEKSKKAFVPSAPKGALSGAQAFVGRAAADRDSVMEEGKAMEEEESDYRQIKTPAPLLAPQKQEALQIEKQSILLEGLRSMDIVIPEEGKCYTFQKLGGNPKLSFSFYPEKLLPRLFILLGMGILIALIFNIRNTRILKSFSLRFPEQKNVLNVLDYFFQWKLTRFIPYLLMAQPFVFRFNEVYSATFFAGGLGLLSILGLRHYSYKRYKKNGFIPPLYWKIYLKYALSYAIVCLFFLSFVLPVVFILLIFAVLLNMLWLVVYAMMTYFTKNISTEAEDKKNSD